LWVRKTLREAIQLVEEQHRFVLAAKITGFKKGVNGVVALSAELNMDTTVAAPAELTNMGQRSRPMPEPQCEDQLMGNSLLCCGMGEDEGLFQTQVAHSVTFTVWSLRERRPGRHSSLQHVASQN
jgi:hypothetical protein